MWSLKSKVNEHNKAELEGIENKWSPETRELRRNRGGRVTGTNL